MYTVKKYTPKDFDIWNQFVATAKNATFLFQRNFMEYHNNRFDDFSLLVFKGENLVAILPANKIKSEVYSHKGLTYGGLVLQNSIGVSKVEIIFNEILEFLRKEHVSTLYLKSIPVFYHKEPSFELEPLLFKLNAICIKKDQNFAIDYRLPIKIHKSKLKKFRKNETLDFRISEKDSFEPFWNQVLIPRLLQKHHTQPVHSLKEIQYLGGVFPENIIQYSIYLGAEILAGITIFKDGNTVKSQYGALTEKGEKYRALDYLFIHLIQKFKSEGFIFFDMGIIAKNYTLLKQKEELGCYQYLQEVYKLNI